MSAKKISERYIFVVNATDDNGHTQDYYFEPCWDGGASMWPESYKDIDKVAGFNSCDEAVTWWNTHKSDHAVLFDKFTVNENSLIKIRIETTYKKSNMNGFFNSLCAT